MNFKKHIRIYSILITLIISYVLIAIEIFLLGEYGFSLFILIPFLIGFLPPYIHGNVAEISLKRSFLLSFFTFLILLVGLLVFALEGLICITMALPLEVFIVASGTYISYLFNKKKWLSNHNFTLGIFILCFLFMSFDHINDSDELIPVKTSLVINAPIARVWGNVISFEEMEKPDDWIFSTGIAYPTHATIEGRGINAVRYCNFTTGSFVEPITKWKEPYLLQFDVEKQPIPMNEFNPFWNIQPPHLRGYFKSRKGEFRLTIISENQTLLEGCTWYQLDITPEFYWQNWSDFIIHRIHLHVLNHIKKLSEKV